MPLTTKSPQVNSQQPQRGYWDLYHLRVDRRVGGWTDSQNVLNPSSVARTACTVPAAQFHAAISGGTVLSRSIGATVMLLEIRGKVSPLPWLMHPVIIMKAFLWITP